MYDGARALDNGCWVDILIYFFYVYNDHNQHPFELMKFDSDPVVRRSC